MGHTGDPEHPEVQTALERAINLVIHGGGIAGTLANDSNLDKFISIGVRCVGVPWQAWVKNSAENFIERTRLD